MRSKKLLCLAIAALMLLSLIPMQIFAEASGTQTNSSVCYIERGGVKTYYDDFVYAVETASVSGDTIVLVKDVTFTKEMSVAGKALTIDGANHSITNTAGVYMWDQLNKGGVYHYPLTMKNATISCYKGFWFNVDEMNFINCNITTTYGLALRNSPPEGVPVTINLTNTTWTLNNNNTANEPFALCGTNNNSDFTFNLVNSDIKVSTGKNILSGDGNHSAFNTYTKGNVDISLDATSSITAYGQYTSSIFCLHSTVASFDLNLAKGATLTLDNSNAGGAFVVNSIGDKLNIVDNGANWVVSAAAAKTGVNLPTFYDANGNEHLWYLGETQVANPYSNASATADVTLTHKEQDDPSKNPLNVAYIVKSASSTKYYTSLANAFVDAVSGDTIKLMKNSEVNTELVPAFYKSATYDGNNVGSLTIDGSNGNGGNYKLSITSSGAFGRIAYYNLTMKNVDFESASMNPFQWQGYNDKTNSKTSTSLFENCNFVQNRNNDGCIFKVTGNGITIDPANTLIKITFKGCNIETSDGVVFLMHHGSNQEINFVDTDVIHKEKFATNLGNSIFNIFHCANATINVDADSTITAAGQAGGTTVSYIFNTHNMVGSTNHAGIQARTITINLAKGSTLKIDGDASRIDNKFINGASKVTFNDNGANYVVGATVAANGVVLPTVSTDKEILGYANGGKLYGTTVTTAGTYKAVKFDKATDLSVMQSAGLKTSGDAAGIAFGVTVSESVLALLGDSVTVGFYIVPEIYKNMVSKGTLDAGDYIKLDATASELTDAGNGMKAAKLGIKGIPLEDSNAAFVKLTAVGFITYTDADGNTTTIYTDNSYTTSLYDLATKSQNQSSDLVKRILALNA